jgi:Transglycosylase SLT domain/SPOR domain
MIRLAGPLFGCALALLSAQANAQAGASPPAMPHQDAAQSGAPNGPQTSTAEPLTTDDICRALERAAAENALPVGFFARVIWQESRFNASAVSCKGAEGIAQFMPRTAEWRGLIDPFDSIAALKASASYLGDLRNRFGNLGLAAAAYNAGPQRVQDWLVGRASLPNETLSYIEIVTGHSASEWSGGTAQSNLALPEVVPCSQMARSFDPAAKSEKGQRNDHASSSPPSKPGWGVQLVGSPSQATALASFQQLQRTYKSLLETRQPFVIQSKVGTSGFWYRVRVVTDTRSDAERLCSGLRTAGGSCLVQRN